MSFARSDRVGGDQDGRPPRLASANCRPTHSGALVAQTTTRSPSWTPSAMRPQTIVRAFRARGIGTYSAALVRRRRARLVVRERAPAAESSHRRDVALQQVLHRGGIVPQMQVPHRILISGVEPSIPVPHRGRPISLPALTARARATRQRRGPGVFRRRGRMRRATPSQAAPRTAIVALERPVRGEPRGAALINRIKADARRSQKADPRVRARQRLRARGRPPPPKPAPPTLDPARHAPRQRG